jgi:hypothetical protein
MKAPGLFGDSPPPPVCLWFFCDERKMRVADSEDWMYISMVVVPDDKLLESLDTLLGLKAKHRYTGELKFSKVQDPAGKSRITAVAGDWLRWLIGSPGRAYWYVLGIAKHNLDFRFFGPGNDPRGKYANIYNRFFRSAFLAAVNSLFRAAEHLVVRWVYHDDEGNLQAHEYFPWHLSSAASDNRITFEHDRICFVSSNHLKEASHPEASHLVQLADLVVGAVSQCLDDTSTKSGKTETAAILMPLLDKVVNPGRSRFFPTWYGISFFPSAKITKSQVEDGQALVRDLFFTGRRLKMRERLAKQPMLLTGEDDEGGGEEGR